MLYSPDRLINFKNTCFSITGEGEKTTFRQGIAYRHQAVPIQISVSGTHYEMGLQYGVLLKDEIRVMATELREIISFYAAEIKIPENVIYLYMQLKINRLARNFPIRFQDEIRGISEGSGVPEDTIRAISLFDDFIHSMGCTSILARTSDGQIIHGRNEDLFFGMELGGKQVVVQYHPKGYHSFVSVAFPGFIGVSTGTSDAGLGYSHNSRFADGVNSDGFPQHCIARMALEECGSLAEVRTLYLNSAVYIGDAHTWSDRTQSDGCVIETAPSSAKPAKISGMEENILWHINRYLDPEYRKSDENLLKSGESFNAARQEILSDALLIRENTLEIDDVLALLRLQSGSRGENYNESAAARGICNLDTQLMVIFDPSGNGMYIAYGQYLASRNDVYYIPFDFSLKPTLYRKGEAVDPVLEEVCAIRSSVMTHNEVIEQLQRVRKHDSEQGYVVLLLAREYYALGDLERWAETIGQMAALSTPYEQQEMLLECAKVAVYRKNPQYALELLRFIQSDKFLSIRKQAEYLYLTEKIYQSAGNKVAALNYEKRFESLLWDGNVHKKICQHIDALFR